MLGYMVNKSVVTHTGCVIVCLLLLFSVWFHFISSLLFKAVQWHLYEVNWWHSADLPVSVGSGHFRVSGFIFVSNGVKIFRMQSQEKSHETLLNVHESTMFCRQLSANTNWCLKILHTAHIFVAYFIICWYRAGSILVWPMAQCHWTALVILKQYLVLSNGMILENLLEADIKDNYFKSRSQAGLRKLTFVSCMCHLEL